MARIYVPGCVADGVGLVNNCHYRTLHYIALHVGLGWALSTSDSYSNEICLLVQGRRAAGLGISL